MRKFLVFLIFSSTFLLVACSITPKDSSGLDASYPVSDVSGGTELPSTWIYTDDIDGSEVTYVLALNSDNTFSYLYQIKEAGTVTMDSRVDGNYLVNGNTIEFTPNNTDPSNPVVLFDNNNPDYLLDGNTLFITSTETDQDYNFSRSE